MNNKSYWQETTSLPTYPSLKHDDTYDIVIVGGGLSGISLAYRLNDSNKRVALLESDTLCSKTTGHTTAKITYLHSCLYDDIKNSYNISTAKQYLDSNCEAFNEIQDIIKTNNIDCDYMINKSYIGSNDKTNNKKIARQIGMFKAWGFEVLENELDDYTISMGLKHQAIFHPLNYVKGLLQKCSNIDINEHSLVTKRTIKNKEVVLDVNGCNVIAKQVIWMTRYPPNLQKAYFIRLLQEKEHVVYKTSKRNHDSILDITNSYSKRFIDQKHILEIEKVECQDAYYWYAQDSIPLRKIPYIGAINKYEYVAYGYNKWGMTLSHVASKLIYELLIYGDSKYKLLYDPNYGRYTKSRKEIKKLVKNNYHGMIKNRFITSKELNLECCQGKVIRHNGTLIAVYKDKAGRKFYFSPVCPHLKCIIEFNEVDQTWDCPCHGSIYDCYGKLVSGPTTSSLKKK